MKQFEVYYNIRVSKIDIELCYWKRIWHYGKLCQNEQKVVIGRILCYNDKNIVKRAIST